MLSPAQKSICDLRLKEHQHDDYAIDIDLGTIVLRDFLVSPGVFRPETTSGLYLAKFLALNPLYYRDMNAIDMGCGSGIQTVVMASLGVRNVIASDVSYDAYQNTGVNIHLRALDQKAVALHGDLFDPIIKRCDPYIFDMMVFNHPFFAQKPDPNEPVTCAWFDDGGLIHRFFSDFRRYFRQDAKAIMPFFEFAGKTNDPAIQARKHGLSVRLLQESYVDDHNIQKGLFSIYLIGK